MQTERMKEYIFYQVEVIVHYSSFQQKVSYYFSPPISVFYPLMTVAEFTKIAICQATV